MAGERQFTVRLDPRVYQRIADLAKREKRSMSQQAAYMLEQALRTLDQQSRSNPNKP